MSSIPTSFNRTFYFYLETGKPLGKMASNLFQFHDVLKTVDVRSIEFHLYREDFEKWLRFLGVNLLATEMARFRKDGLRGEILREKMCDAVERYL